MSAAAAKFDARPWWRRASLRAALLTALVGGALAAAMTSVADQHAHQSLQRETEILATQVAGRIRGCVETRVAMVSSLQREWRLGALHDPASFGARVETLIATFPGYLAINTINPAGVIREIYPRSGNEKALGHSIFENQIAAPIFANVRETGHIALTPPVDLFQGGRGFALYLPLDEDGSGGFLNGVFRAADLIPSCLGGAISDHALALSDGRELFARGHMEAAGIAVATNFSLLNREWTLTLQPSEQHMQADRRPVVLFRFIATGLVLVLAIAAYLMVNLAERNRIHRETLQHTQRMESLGALARGVAHDFNNLVLGIKLLANKLEQQVEQRETKERLMQIVSTAESASSLTRSLLAFARCDEAVLVELPLEPIVRHATELVQPLVEGRILIVREMNAAPHVLGDAVQLEQVLLNLLNNARDAMTHRSGEILLRVGTQATWAIIDVIDQGVGIAPSIRDRIFEPYFTTKTGGELRGTGLGLATARQIVERHGGRIEVRDNPAGGTWMQVWLPLAPSA
jgi:signal transduction histidine kinase